MNEARLAGAVKKKLGAIYLGQELKKSASGEQRVFVRVDADRIKEATNILFRGFNARLCTVAAVELKRVFELSYIFSFDKEGVVVALKAEIPKEKPAIDSITDVTNGSNFIEREIHDFFGINFRGHPELKRLVLPDDWPKGKYPLRKGE